MNEELKTASDMARDPASVSIATYMLLVVVSILGGVVRVIREVNLGEKTVKQVVAVFLGEMIISLFVGMTTFFLCQDAGFSMWKTAALVCVGSFLGGKVLVVFEAIYKARLGSKGD